MSDWLWAGLALAFALALAWQLRARHRLMRWLERRTPGDPPTAAGAWDEVNALIMRERREAARREAELQYSLTRLQEAARALPDGVVVLEGESVEWCNDTARSHLALDPAKDSGHPITHIFRLPEFVDYLEARDYARPVEIRLPDSRVLSVQVVPFGDERRVVLSRDITRFERMEASRREFVANVSHEMRTPLTVISGFLETLREGGVEGAEAKHYLELMRDQAQRMERLVADLLTLSALEASPPPPMEETIDMAALVSRMGAEARALSSGRHTIEVRSDPGPVLLGSEREIASAFANLVGNAVRYTPPGGRVELSWRATADGAAFEVADNGIGIAAEHIPRLTERFYRVDRGRSRETGGTGLGLAIVKHALVRHGAQLEIRSAPGEGSRFTARFSGPRLRAAPATPPADAAGVTGPTRG
jgi:two-component system phosphate regulon sensor histidine kinase PhoR